MSLILFFALAIEVMLLLTMIEYYDNRTSTTFWGGCGVWVGVGEMEVAGGRAADEQDADHIACFLLLYYSVSSLFSTTY